MNWDTVTDDKEEGREVEEEVEEEQDVEGVT